MEEINNASAILYGEEIIYVPVSAINVPGYLRDLPISQEERARVMAVIANPGLEDAVHVYCDSDGYTLLSNPHYVEIARELNISKLRCILIHHPVGEFDS